MQSEKSCGIILALSTSQLGVFSVDDLSKANALAKQYALFYLERDRSSNKLLLTMVIIIDRFQSLSSGTKHWLQRPH